LSVQSRNGAQSQNGAIEHVEVPVAEPVRPVAERSRLMVALPLPRSPVTAAAGGLMAGGALVTLVRVVLRRRAPVAGGRRRKDLRRGAVASRSFLVDVHVLDR
jgi:hypothetical protein